MIAHTHTHIYIYIYTHTLQCTNQNRVDYWPNPLALHMSGEPFRKWLELLDMSTPPIHIHSQMDLSHRMWKETNRGVHCIGFFLQPASKRDIPLRFPPGESKNYAPPRPPFFVPPVFRPPEASPSGRWRRTWRTPWPRCGRSAASSPPELRPLFVECFGVHLHRLGPIESF